MEDIAQRPQDVIDDRFFTLHFGISKEEVRSRVILTPFLPVNYFAAYAPGMKIMKKRSIETGISEMLTVIRTGMGGPATGDVVLMLNNTGCKTILFVGSCGGIGKAAIGDIILAESVCIGEGFSNYFLPGRQVNIQENIILQADSGLLSQFSDYCSRNNTAFTTGRVFSVGTMFAETKELIQTLENMCFLGVEMEVSSLYSAARFCGMKALALLYVADLPSSKPFFREHSAEDKDKIKAARSALVQSAVEFITAGPR